MQLAPTIALALFGLAGAAGHKGEARPKMKPTDYQETCREIAQDIERLGAKVPKLAGFSAANNLGDDCDIDYSHGTRPPPREAGWRGGARTAGPDGIVLYLHLWDHDAPTRQLDTQRVQRSLRIGRRRVSLLVDESDNLPGAYEAIADILRAHGMVEGKPEPVTLSEIPGAGEMMDVVVRPVYPADVISPPLKTDAFAALMDAARPIGAGDRHLESRYRQPWLEATFTARGNGYRVTLFEGGRGRLDLPDDAFGYFDVAPKVWKKIGGPPLGPAEM
jgi:hypothetical protein